MRTGRCVLTLIIVSVCGTVSAQAATSAQQDGDAKCLLLSGGFSNAADPKAKQAAFAAHFFYLGRLRGETASNKLPDVIVTASKTILPALAGASMRACVAEVAAAENDVAQAGKQIKAAPAK